MAQSSDESIYRDPPHAAVLRARLRRLITEHLPTYWLGPFTNDPADLVLSNHFCEVLANEGLLVPNWPVEYGGQAADLATSIVIREEMWAQFEPRGGQYYGPNWVGPSISDLGTPEQKALHLPLIAEISRPSTPPSGSPSDRPSPPIRAWPSPSPCVRRAARPLRTCTSRVVERLRVIGYGSRRCLALRWATIDIARRVLCTAHQGSGAAGLCDEHDMTIITLGLQAACVYRLVSMGP
jgi:hypothetical protein